MSQSKQNRLMFLCWLVYTGSYIGRYGYNANINLIMSHFGTTHAQAGLVTTMFFFSYGFGQILNAFLCKYYPKKYVLAGAMLISAGVNIAIYVGIPFVFIKYLWLIHGLALSTLWTSLMLILADHLEKKNLQKAVIIMSSTVAAGTFFAYGGSALFSKLGNFKLSFLFASFTMLVLSLLWFFSYSNICDSKQQPPSTKVLPKAVSESQSSTETPPKSHRRLTVSVLMLMIVLSLISVVSNLIKDGLTTWVPSILKESFGLSDSLSILLTLFMPIVSLCVAALNVILHKWFPDFVTHSGVWFLIATAAIVGAIAVLQTSYWILLLLFFIITSIATYGVNNITTNMGPMYLREHMNAAVMSGILNGCCYVGSTISSYALGYLADTKGWNSVFYLFLICSIASVIICALWKLFKKKSIS